MTNRYDQICVKVQVGGDFGTKIDSHFRTPDSSLVLKSPSKTIDLIVKNGCYPKCSICLDLTYR